MKKHTTLSTFFIFLLFTIFLAGCSMTSQLGEKEGTYEKELEEGIEKQDLKVHYIDVGQGDAILIESAGAFMLIDAGENDMGERVVAYLKQCGVETLDYVIGTHPHSDHIGGLDTVIRAFEVKKVIIPEKEHTTKTFEDVLDAVMDKGLKLTKPIVGNRYEIGAATFTIIAPNKDYGDNLNNWSVGVKLTYQDVSYVMYGDAEVLAEKDIMANGIDLKADVLKLSHHGSETSSMEEIIDCISPKVAVIMVGEDNKYGHPHREILDLMKEKDIKVYRTDELGNLVVSTDGSSISVTADSFSDTEINDTKSDDAESNDTQNSQKIDKEQVSHEETYILNLNSKKFHFTSCKYTESIKEENSEVTNENREKLLDQGFSPCGSCKP